ncbi:D-arabino 3-hexulose 6-phosphate formaldehyde lyase isolog [Methanocaldococcus jannaschii DSM 2661]|uniref:Bifunctional enzyme Fae/Hps n=1 Tax=Methanocaldococcus jannaschii (strain ATCC 43067 / DSM 2661 / JAL-1 / JCM 10045 / NBRC 100440) TaxID=243232 RepID=FAEHP_METJA|nr:bifunctional 5,6,7,8-tetrahydromethanopterin hydro-lyase/3-hexulose-6-phosphate synthase [Methanocaldococcus jannaschii]Q58842.1 RecName: Full=Bifunctional enzyme Fae/Hps; Includes: RecName: Full=5,6,7,8-tetrahydromethanopterin hydro-lyase; AltName: Full=Formaldehyde-activating enzyme; Short=Fae; Includes: RecName: Full=3-hexulose-6-phosphate synthase; Short=HPS; AltName: Full=D-arabino-3-hexulose-6-phosphate formaldehyde lyase [Methanocaldococcus jannaschii DSM 2661]AAB99456.1 D-arabino 3-hex
MIKFGEAVLGNEIKAIVNVALGKGELIENTFTNALTRGNCVFANLRPNLIVKPLTLVVPRHNIESEIQDELFQGVIQYAVAKAVADLDLDEDLKVVVSVNVPEVPITNLNKRKLFQYFYASAKLAINRALNEYPSKEKVKKEKYRALHPLVGFRDVRLEYPPYLQIALDVPTMENLEFLLQTIPNSDHIILEAGTPLIKKFGLEVIEIMREYFDGFIVADLKTLDTGRVEVRLAFEATANAVAISGVAPKSTIIKAIHECQKCGLISYLDMMNVSEPQKLYDSLKLKPDVVILHRGIDEETFGIKKEWKFKENCLLAIAGGVGVENVEELLKEYQILIVGRAITKSKDPGRVIRMFINKMGYDIDTYRLYFDEDEDIGEEL